MNSIETFEIIKQNNIFSIQFYRLFNTVAMIAYFDLVVCVIFGASKKNRTISPRFCCFQLPRLIPFLRSN